MMHAGNPNSGERVRESTSAHKNAAIDASTLGNILIYGEGGGDELDARIAALDRQWDIERVLGVNMSVVALAGLALGWFVHVYWLALPAVVLLFFLQHSLQGWCPPIPIFRAMKIRTRPEIDREKYALKAIRGDFADTEHDPGKAWEAVNA